MASDFFSDKKYENLDWISQAVEPWEWDLLDGIRQMPETIEVTLDDITRHYDSYYGFQWIPFLRGRLVDIMGGEPNSAAAEYLHSLYKLSLEEGTEVNFIERTISNPIRLIKQRPTLTDDECKKAAGDLAARTIHSTYLDMRDTDQYRRAGEILDLLGANMAEYRGHRNRSRAFSVELRKIFEGDKWRIRSMDLVVKSATWIANYIQSGDVSAMANFAKLKVMTHAGKPLYSITEVE